MTSLTIISSHKHVNTYCTYKNDKLIIIYKINDLIGKIKQMVF